MINENEWFSKRSETFSPHDLLWVKVTYFYSNQEVTISDEKSGDEIKICIDRKHQIDELIEILKHIRDNLPLGERKED